MSINPASLKAFWNREHTLAVSADRLNRILGRPGAPHHQTFAKDLEALAIAITPGALMASGRFHHNGWSGQFHIRLRPVHVIWETQRHTLVFKILDHDIRFDRSLKGLLAAIGMATVNGLFGKNFILHKTVAILDGDRVQFELDHLNHGLQPLLEAITLCRIECIENALRLHFRVHPGRALRLGGRLVYQRLIRPTRQPPPENGTL